MPDVPDVPSIPDDPLVPVEPEEPDVPVVPDDPAVPDVPDVLPTDTPTCFILNIAEGEAGLLYPADEADVENNSTLPLLEAKNNSK